MQLFLHICIHHNIHNIFKYTESKNLKHNIYIYIYIYHIIYIIHRDLKPSTVVNIISISQHIFATLREESTGSKDSIEIAINYTKDLFTFLLSKRLGLSASFWN